MERASAREGARRRLAGIASLALLLVACADGATPPVVTSPAGLARLPCIGEGALRSAHARYCAGEGRHWVTPQTLAVMQGAAARFVRQHPGSHLTYMEASWPSGKRPMPPHLSHGDGREIDVALFYVDASRKPLARPPFAIGYGAFEPPLRGEPRPCKAAARPGGFADPGESRDWRLDEARTRDLIRSLLADPRVRRILIEPHLKQRLGFANEARLRFPGCYTLRHDSHIHVDVF